VERRRDRRQRIHRAFVQQAIASIAERGDFLVSKLVNKPEMTLYNFYRLFDGKEDLAAAVVKENIRQAISEIEKKIEDETEPWNRLRHFVAFALEWVEDPKDSPYRRWLIANLHKIQSERPEMFEAMLKPLIELLVNEIEAGQRAGVVRDEPPRRLVFPLLNTIQGAIESEAPRPFENTWNFCSQALAAPKPPPTRTRRARRADGSPAAGRPPSKSRP